MSHLTKKKVRKHISKLNLEPYIHKAIRLHTVKPTEVIIAKHEYRQFLLLLWIKQTMGEKGVLVPSKRASALWHEHVDDDALYKRFCIKITLMYVPYHEGLPVGSKKYDEAVAFTRKLHKEHGSGGFTSDYLKPYAGSHVIGT